MDKSIFFNELAAQFRSIFLLSKQGCENSTQRMRAQGFIHAGELLKLCHKNEVQDLMETIHKEVFGCEIAQRVSYKAKRAQAMSAGDYEYFDEPAINRKE